MEEAITVKRGNTYTGHAKTKEGDRAQPMRVHEVVTEKRSDTERAPYAQEKTSLGRRRREVMTVEARELDQPTEPDLYQANLRDVVPHEDNPVVISVVTVGRRVQKRG